MGVIAVFAVLSEANRPNPSSQGAAHMLMQVTHIQLDAAFFSKRKARRKLYMHLIIIDPQNDFWPGRIFRIGMRLKKHKEGADNT
jgi:hypothetical protein